MRALRVGVGYLSDLAESDERFLRAEGDRYIQRVSAWNAYALFGFDKFEITAENSFVRMISLESLKNKKINR